MRAPTFTVPLLAVPLCVASFAAPAAAQSPGDEVLLIPNSGRDSISVCSADGNLVSLYFSYLTYGSPLQPIQVVPSGLGTLLMTDLDANALVELSASGEYIRTLAGPQHGLSNAFGVAVSGGFAYVTEPGLATGEVSRIWKVPVDGSAPPSVFFDFTPLGIPRGIVRVQTPSFDGFYVGDQAGEDIERITIAGQALAPFHDSDGVTGFDFPNQLLLLADGTLLVAGGHTPAGVYRFDANGNQISFVSATAPWGIHPLSEETYVYTSGGNVWQLDTETGVSTYLHQGTSSDSFRFITPWRIPSACPADLNASGAVDGVDLAALLAQWGTNGSADLTGDGTVSGADLTFVLSAWGPC